MKLVELAPVIVKNALRVKENEVLEITLTGERRYFPFLDEITLAITKLGAFPTIRLNTPSYRKRYLEEVPIKYIRRTPPQALKRIKYYNRHINILADDPDPHFDNIPAAKYRAAWEARRPIIEQIQRRNISEIYLPTPELANYFKMPEDEFIESVYSALNIDYKLLRHACKKVSRLMNKPGKEIRIKTGSNFELILQLGERPIFIEDGSRTLPAGSVFVAPIETSVRGSILIKSGKMGNRIVENLVLSFEEGKIVSSSADKNHSAFVRKLKNAYGDKDIFAGIGIGLNPGVKQMTHCDVLDTRVMGSVHIGLGSNLIFGGRNFSDIFFTLVSTDADVFFGKTCLIDSGHFVTDIFN